VSYNLALCYHRLGDTAIALGHLDQAVMGTSDPKRKLKIKQIRTALVTGESSAALKNDDRDRVNRVNQLMEAIGFDASVEEGPPVLEEQAPRTAIASGESRKPARPKVSMCQALGALKDQQSHRLFSISAIAPRKTNGCPMPPGSLSATWKLRHERRILIGCV